MVDPHGAITRRRSTSVSSRDHHHHLHKLHEDEEEENDNSSENSSETMSTAPREKRDDLINPYWIEDPDIRKGEVDYLSSTEIQFWKDMLDQYLYPIDEDKAEQVSSMQNNYEKISKFKTDYYILICFV